MLCAQGKTDEAMVLTTTPHSRVECVSSDQASQLLTATSDSPSPLSDSSEPQRHSDTVSPPQKRLRADDQLVNSSSVETTITNGDFLDPNLGAQPFPKIMALLSYKVSWMKLEMCDYNSGHLDKQDTFAVPNTLFVYMYINSKSCHSNIVHVHFDQPLKSGHLTKLI